MVSAENDPRRAGTIWAVDLDRPAPHIAPQVPAHLARAGPEAAPALAAAMGLEGPAGVLQRFEGRRWCYVARVEGQVAAYGWVSFEEEMVGELRLRLRFLPGEAYIWDCATQPAFRRQRLYTALLSHILADLRAEGLCRAWIGADMDNLPSQRGMALAGFQHVADLTIARALALRLIWVRGRPGVPDALVQDARRVFLGNRDQAWLAALSAAHQHQVSRRG